MISSLASSPLIRPNLLAQPSALDNAAWTKFALTATADQTSAPDGALTADAAVPTAVNNEHYARQTVTHAINSPFAFALSAKANGYNFVVLRALAITGAPRAYFNVATGAVATVGAGLTASVAPQANGFYRCAIRYATGGSVPFDMVEIGVSNADNTAIFLADGVSGLYLWGAKLELGATATRFVA